VYFYFSSVIAEIYNQDVLFLPCSELFKIRTTDSLHDMRNDSANVKGTKSNWGQPSRVYSNVNGSRARHDRFLLLQNL
jgi:hypothetical protein